MLQLRALHVRARPWLAASRGLSKFAGGNKEGEYDLCVIGGGPAGFAGAVRGWDFGGKVALVEKGKIWGAGMWDGALSSKILWQLSRSTRQMREYASAKGKLDSDLYMTWQDVVSHVNEAQAHKIKQYMAQIEALKHGYHNNEKASMDFYHGEAHFQDPHTLAVLEEGEDGSTAEKTIRAKNFLICTGSTPRKLRGFPFDGNHIMTSDDIFRLPDFPKSVLIIGAGVIGCEFATIFGAFGESEVHLLNQGKSRLLPAEDVEVSTLIQSNLQRLGVHVHNNSQLLDLRLIEGRGVEVTLGHPVVDEDDDKVFMPDPPFFVERVLFSVGRSPQERLEKLNLEAAGVSLDRRGGLQVDDEGRCVGTKHIFGAGDCTLTVGLVNVAEMEARHAVEVMAGAPKDCLTNLGYNHVSSIMFLYPEVACVGISEQEARKKKIPHLVARLGLDVVNRAIINLHGSRAISDKLSPRRAGFVKMICTDDEEKRLLGMRFVGQGAGSIIQAGAMLISQKRSVREIERLLHPHPAVTEAVQEVARMLSGYTGEGTSAGSIFKPHVFPQSCRVTRYKPAFTDALADSHEGKADVPNYVSSSD